MSFWTGLTVFLIPSLQKVHWTHYCLHTSSLYTWWTDDAIELEDKSIYECNQESIDHQEYTRRQLLAVVVQFTAEVGLWIIDDGCGAPEEVLGDTQPDSSHAGVIVLFPNAAGNYEGDWEPVHVPACPSAGHKQSRKNLDTTRG